MKVVYKCLDVLWMGMDALLTKRWSKACYVSPRQKQTDTKSVLIMNTIHSGELLEKTTVKPQQMFKETLIVVVWQV